MRYVVYWCEHLRDGHEEGAKVLPTLESALEFLSSAATRWFAGSNYEFRLFELGREVPLERTEMEEEVKVSSQKRVRYRKQGGDLRSL